MWNVVLLFLLGVHPMVLKSLYDRIMIEHAQLAVGMEVELGHAAHRLRQKHDEAFRRLETMQSDWDVLLHDDGTKR